MVEVHMLGDVRMNPSSSISDGTQRQSHSQEADPTPPEHHNVLVPDTPVLGVAANGAIPHPFQPTPLAMSVVGADGCTDGAEIGAPVPIDEAVPQRCSLCPASAAAVPIRDALTGKCNLFYVSGKASVVRAKMLRPGALVCEAICFQNRDTFPEAPGRRAEAVLDLSCFLCNTTGLVDGEWDKVRRQRTNNEGPGLLVFRAGGPGAGPGHYFHDECLKYANPIPKQRSAAQLKQETGESPPPTQLSHEAYVYNAVFGSASGKGQRAPLPGCHRCSKPYPSIVCGEAEHPMGGGSTPSSQASPTGDASPAVQGGLAGSRGHTFLGYDSQVPSQQSLRGDPDSDVQKKTGKKKRRRKVQHGMDFGKKKKRKDKRGSDGGHSPSQPSQPSPAASASQPLPPRQYCGEANLDSVLKTRPRYFHLPCAWLMAKGEFRLNESNSAWNFTCCHEELPSSQPDQEDYQLFTNLPASPPSQESQQASFRPTPSLAMAMAMGVDDSKAELMALVAHDSQQDSADADAEGPEQDKQEPPPPPPPVKDDAVDWQLQHADADAGAALEVDGIAASIKRRKLEAIEQGDVHGNVNGQNHSTNVELSPSENENSGAGNDTATTMDDATQSMDELTAAAMEAAAAMRGPAGDSSPPCTPHTCSQGGAMAPLSPRIEEMRLAANVMFSPSPDPKAQAQIEDDGTALSGITMQPMTPGLGSPLVPGGSNPLPREFFGDIDRESGVPTAAANVLAAVAVVASLAGELSEETTDQIQSFTDAQPVNTSSSSDQTGSNPEPHGALATSPAGPIGAGSKLPQEVSPAEGMALSSVASSGSAPPGQQGPPRIATFAADISAELINPSQPDDQRLGTAQIAANLLVTPLDQPSYMGQTSEASPTPGQRYTAPRRSFDTDRTQSQGSANRGGSGGSAASSTTSMSVSPAQRRGSMSLSSSTPQCGQRMMQDPMSGVAESPAASSSRHRRHHHAAGRKPSIGCNQSHSQEEEEEEEEEENSLGSSITAGQRSESDSQPGNDGQRFGQPWLDPTQMAYIAGLLQTSVPDVMLDMMREKLLVVWDRIHLLTDELQKQKERRSSASTLPASVKIDGQPRNGADLAKLQKHFKDQFYNAFMPESSAMLDTDHEMRKQRRKEFLQAADSE